MKNDDSKLPQAVREFRSKVRSELLHIDARAHAFRLRALPASSECGEL